MAHRNEGDSERPRRLNGWVRALVPIALLLVGGLVGYGELKKGVTALEEDSEARVALALDRERRITRVESDVAAAVAAVKQNAETAVKDRETVRVTFEGMRADISKLAREVSELVGEVRAVHSRDGRSRHADSP